MELVHIALEDLRNHPLNAKVFGQLNVEADCDSFIESVKTHGIQVPLQVTPAREDGSHMILSGHRRRQAAAKAGLKSIPCIIRHDVTTPELTDLVWSEANLQREMTTDQRARFYETRKAIEMAMANLRKQATQIGSRTVGGNSPHRKNKGKSREVAAAAVGLSPKTAEKAVEVVHEIDAAIEAGDIERAEDLRHTLNTKSVAEAHRKAAGIVNVPETAADIVCDDLQRPVPGKFRTAHANGQRIGTIARTLDKVARELKEVADGDGGDVLRGHLTRITSWLKDAKRESMSCAYWTCCPSCDGKRCKRCDELGWIPERKSGGLTAKEKETLGVK